jgi:hypothetical protein
MLVQRGICLATLGRDRWAELSLFVVYIATELEASQSQTVATKLRYGFDVQPMAAMDVEW